MAKKTLVDKTPQNEDAVKNNDDILNDDEEPNFSDPEGFVDDITDEGRHVLFKMTFNNCCPTSKEGMVAYNSEMWHMRHNLQKSNRFVYI